MQGDKDMNKLRHQGEPVFATARSSQAHATGTAGSKAQSAPVDHQLPISNSEMQERLKAARSESSGPEGMLAAGRTPTSITPGGQLSYYKERHDDFANFYKGTGVSAPNYYMGYGDKYVRRFTNETFERLSPEGQAWMERVRVGLQVAIEDERASDPAAFDRLERDDAAFTSFAYDTHPEAYWQAGLGELPVGDLANIGLTPDVKDLLAWDGLVQVGDIALRLAMKWGEDGIDALAGEGTTDQMGEALLDGFEMIGAGIDDIAGPGTSDLLESAAIQTGQDLAGFAQGAAKMVHGVAREGAEALLGVGDVFLGEGETMEALDELREGASDGVDWIEDRFEDLLEWIWSR